MLDQNKLVSSVGNWVADEVLFQAGIHPESRATLSDAQVARLHESLRDVLWSRSDATEAEAFPPTWLFHYRWGKGAVARRAGQRGGSISFSTVGGAPRHVLSRQHGGEDSAGAGSLRQGQVKAKGKSKQEEDGERTRAAKRQ